MRLLEKLEDINLPIFSIPVSEFTTKKDHVAQKCCPTLPKLSRRRKGNSSPIQQVAQVISSDSQNKVKLSSKYRRKLSASYFDQIFFKKSKIGEGSFGNVYRAVCIDDNKTYAIKHFNSSHSMKSKYKEIANMEKLGKHKNVLKFYMAWREDQDVYIKMECCQMSLGQYSKSNHNISNQQLCEIFHDMVDALEYLHSRALVHLDVKPDNILIEKGHYKLCDFGLLFDLHSSAESFGKLPSEGDSRYLAPEVLDGIYTPGADIFSLGVSILELGTDYLMPANGCVWHAIRSGEASEDLPSKMSNHLISLVYKMMSKEYNKRPTANLLKSCSLFRDIATQNCITERTDFLNVAAAVESHYLDIDKPLSTSNQWNVTVTPKRCVGKIKRRLF